MAVVMPVLTEVKVQSEVLQERVHSVILVIQEQVGSGELGSSLQGTGVSRVV